MKDIIVKVLMKFTHFTQPYCEKLADEILKELQDKFGGFGK